MSLQEESAAYRGKAQQMLGDKFQVLENGVEIVKRSGLEQGAVHVGQKAPEFTLPDAFGKQVALKDLLKNGPVVINFYRGEWCPFCNMELKAFQDLLPQFKQLDTTLVAISPEKPEFAKLAIDKNQLTFPVLTDSGNTVARSFGLVFEVDNGVKELTKNVFQKDLATRNADSSWDLPVPATFVIDAEGIVRYAHVDADYMTGRADPQEVLATLKTQAQPA